MTPEVAKKLKDSGFPLEMSDHIECVYHHTELIDGILYHIPTLEELIEACGEQLLGMQRGSGGWDVVGMKMLTNKDRMEGKPPQLDSLHTQDASLAIAIANLYLKLNE